MKLRRISSLTALGTVIAGSACLSLAAHGAAIYTSAISFDNALQPGAYTESTWAPSPGATGTDTLNYNDGGSGIAYTVTLSDGDTFWVNGGGTGGVAGLSTANPGVTMTFDFTPSTSPVTAVGGIFTITDSEEFTTPGDFRLTLSDGTVVNLSTSGGTPEYFRGFTTSGGTHITSLLVSGSPPDGPGTAFTTVKSLTVGYAAVPEPAVVASVTGLGLLGLGMLHRRTRRA